MSIIIERFKKIQSNVEEQKPKKKINIVAVSKTFSLDHIMPLINFGHTHFGENKVQEAIEKWTEVKKKNSQIKLHMVGKLQTNKAKNAIDIFEYIHSLDNQKLADILSKTQVEKNKFLKYFIQVNIGDESQKSGIPISELDSFFDYCKKEINLEIIGLMIIPPVNDDPKKYFKLASELNSSLAFGELSMGMSADFIEAIRFNSTFIRIGSLIFGNRF